MAGALCTASFLTGHLLFGQDTGPPPTSRSLLSQYKQAKGRMVKTEESEAPAELVRESKVVSQSAPPKKPNATPQPLAMLNSQVRSLRPAAIQPADEVVLNSTQRTPRLDTEVRPAVAHMTADKKPVVIQASASSIPPDSKVDEENLPPIVPAWSVPRPGTRKR